VGTGTETLLHFFSLTRAQHFSKNALTSMPSSTAALGMRVRVFLEEWRCTSEEKGAAG
jgi:hypothetical protein